MRQGFTLVELLLVMGIMMLLFSIGSVSFFRSQGHNLLAQGVDVLAADLRSQQTKAMTGAVLVSGIEQPGYGIHFDTTMYTLFAGDTYIEGAATNSVVELPAGVEMTSTTFPGGDVVFLRASGEVKNFVTGQDYVELKSTANEESWRVRVNRLGVIVEGI